MENRHARRVTRDLTDAEQQHLRQQRELIAQELPELAERDQLRKEASTETTLSGELRRTIHASPMSLSEIAAGVGITGLALDEFLTGERTLRSDVLDRLAKVVGFRLQAIA